MKCRFSILAFAVIGTACSSAPPTPSIPPTPPPTEESKPTATVEVAATVEPPTPSDTATPLPATATLAPTPTPTSDAVPCPLTGVETSETALAERRPILVQIGNSNPERPQFGLAQADMVFETLSEGGITRFSAIYLCQDALDIAGVRSGRLINLHLVPMLDAIFVHVGASEQVQAMFENDSRIRDSSLDYFRNHPGFAQEPDRRRPPFDVFTSTDALWAAARERNIEIPGRPLPTVGFSEDPPPGGTAISSATIRHHIGYWVRWKWDADEAAWTRHISNEGNPDTDVPHVDAEIGRTLTTKNVIIIRAQHRQTDIVEDSQGSRSIELDLLGAGDAWFLRDGQLYEGKWERAEITDWFTLTLADDSAYAFAPGNSYIHFYQPKLPLDTMAR